MQCIHCQSTIAFDSVFCPRCGERIHHHESYTPAWATLTSEDWKQIASEFNEWRKTTTLTTIGRVLTHNAAWDNYYAGYSDGFAAGIERALARTVRQSR